MSRGGRGGRGGGRGGFGGSSSNMPPMGLSFADIQSIPKEESELFPLMDPIPNLTDVTENEIKIAHLQQGFVARLRQSPYYLVEESRSTELPRYSDKYRPQMKAQPTLKKTDLNKEFFPPSLWDSVFNPRKKANAVSKVKRRKLNLDEIQEDGPDGEEEKGSEDGSEADSQVAEDYDAEEEEGNDYEANYFENGEDDDVDDIVGGDDAGDFD